ncbi:MAG TPA: TetR family transcriptional regulator [Casimicrobiaceae bacterium]|nr:TetR family transcriptional regulator [Casimicrobiaceae bacterium]
MANGLRPSPALRSPPVARAPVARKRDPMLTRDRVLRAGIVEFCRHGYIGARIDQIAKRAGCNMRMIYHYFGSKEKLYVAVLERVFGELRLEESRLHLAHLDPVAGVVALVDFTMDHLGRHPEFVALLGNENLLRGKYLRRSHVVPRASAPLLEAIRDLLERGRASGAFGRDVDPLQFYVSVLSLCYVHVSNRYTLSITFNRDITDPGWLDARRRHVQQMVLAYLCAANGARPETKFATAAPA